MQCKGFLILVSACIGWLHGSPLSSPPATSPSRSGQDCAEVSVLVKPKGSHARDFTRSHADGRIWHSGGTRTAGRLEVGHVSIFHVRRLSPAPGARDRNRNGYGSGEPEFSRRDKGALSDRGHRSHH